MRGCGVTGLRRTVIPLVLAAGLLSSCGRRHDPRVVVAYPSGLSSLMPDRANEEFSISILRNLYESLVDFDGKLALQPGLAESWYTEDDTTWVFRLRPGLRFHDGRAVEAADVVSSLEHARSDPDSKRRGELSAIRAINAPNERTVIIHTEYPFASLPHRLANVTIWAPAGREGDPPWGTGPYRVRRWVPRGDIVLEAFDGYPGGPPPIRLLEFKVVPGVQERLEMLKRGEVNLVADVPPEALPELAADDRIRTLAEKGLRVLFLGFDCAHPTSPYLKPPANAFLDAQVRRAVAMAIDRQALVSGPLGGQAEVVDQIVAPAVFGFHPNLPPIRYDPLQARQMMAAAGRSAGFAAQLHYMPAKYRAMDAVVKAVAGDLAQVGVRLTPLPQEPDAFIHSVEGQDVGLYLWGWMSTGGDAGVSYDYLLRTPKDGFGVDNGGGYANAEVDRLLADANTRLKPEERRKLLWKVAELVAVDMPVVPLYRQTDLYALSWDLDFEPRVDRRIRGSQLRWKRPR